MALQTASRLQRCAFSALHARDTSYKQAAYSDYGRLLIGVQSSCLALAMVQWLWRKKSLLILAQRP